MIPLDRSHLESGRGSRRERGSTEGANSPEGLEPFQAEGHLNGSQEQIRTEAIQDVSSPNHPQKAKASFSAGSGKSFPEETSELTMDQLSLIAGGHSAFQLLWAGIELGLYDRLSASSGLTLEEVASQLEINHQPARVLLTGLCALGIIVKKRSNFYNAKITEKMLVSTTPGNAVKILGWQRHIVYEGLLDFVDSLKQDTNVGLGRFPGPGDTLYQNLVEHPALEHTFQDAMSSLSTQANQALLSGYDLSRFHHIVDAGGGDGTNAIALALRYPSLKVTVFDRESVCEIAKKNIAKAGLSARVDTWVGDFFHDPFPRGIDGILYSHILTIWSADENIEVLKRSYEALPVGGSVLVFNMMGDDDETGPITTALGSPYFLAIATGKGMLYPWKDYEAWIHRAGFTETERIDDLPLNHGLLVGKRR